MMTCCATSIRVWGINGTLILHTNLESFNIDPIQVCKFYEVSRASLLRFAAKVHYYRENLVKSLSPAYFLLVIKRVDF